MDLNKMLEEYVDQNVDQLLRSDAEYQRQATSVISAEELKERERNALKEEFLNTEARERLTKGFALLVDGLPSVLDEEQWETAQLELASMGEALLRFSESGRKEATFQEMIGLTIPTMQGGYDLGMDLIDQEKWEEAIDLFGLLVSLNGRLSPFWVGFGRAMQGKQEYEAAVELFRIAAAMDEHNPAPHFYACLSHIELGNLEEASHDLHNLESVGKEEIWRSAAKRLGTAIQQKGGHKS